MERFGGILINILGLSSILIGCIFNGKYKCKYKVTIDYLELYNLQTLIHMYWILAYQVYPVWDWLRTLPFPAFGYYTKHFRKYNIKMILAPLFVDYIKYLGQWLDYPYSILSSFYMWVF